MLHSRISPQFPCILNRSLTLSTSSRSTWRSWRRWSRRPSSTPSTAACLPTAAARAPYGCATCATRPCVTSMPKVSRLPVTLCVSSGRRVWRSYALRPLSVSSPFLGIVAEGAVLSSASRLIARRRVSEKVLPCVKGSLRLTFSCSCEIHRVNRMSTSVWGDTSPPSSATVIVVFRAVVCSCLALLIVQWFISSGAWWFDSAADFLRAGFLAVGHLLAGHQVYTCGDITSEFLCPCL